MSSSERKRRSRMHRQSRGKRIELSSRDVSIFKLLHRYRYLRSTFLHAFVGGKMNRFKERLGDLYHDGRYLNRPEQQWQFAGSRSMPAVYENGARAERVLRQLGYLDDGLSIWLSRGRMGAHRQFSHALMICDILASIELGVRDDPHVEFISWERIIENASEETRRAANPFQLPVSVSYTAPKSGKHHAADFKLTPDGLFGLKYTEGGTSTYRFFALEADRMRMPVKRTNLRQSSYLKKLLAYRQIIAKKVYQLQLGLPNLLVLNVTTSKRHMATIQRTLDELTGGAGSSVFLFKTMSALGDFQRAPEPTPHMLTDPWQRVGHEPFYIQREAA